MATAVNIAVAGGVKPTMSSAMMVALTVPAAVADTVIKFALNIPTPSGASKVTEYPKPAAA